MTVEDRVRQTLVTRAAASPPTLPGLYRDVQARASAVRRRRRITYATAAGSLVVSAVLAPLAVGERHRATPGPSASTTIPSPNASAPAPAPALPSRDTPPAVSTTRIPGTARHTLPPATNRPPVAFPTGPAAALPLFLGDGNGFFVERNGKVSRRIATYFEPFHVVATPYGILAKNGSRLLLLHDDDTVTTVFSRKGLFVWAVRPDGKMLAWGTRIQHGMGTSLTWSSEIGLLDLASGAVSDVRSTSLETGPTGFLADGRVTANSGQDGAVGRGIIWTPSTGLITVPDGTARSLQAVGGHTYLVGREDGCWFHDVVTGRQLKASCLPTVVSPDGRRVLSDGVDAGGFAPLVDVSTGRVDRRLAQLLRSRGLRASDAQWIDDSHVQMIASTWHHKPLPQDEWALVLTCAVPPEGQVSCRQSQAFGPLNSGLPASPQRALPQIVPGVGQ